MSALVEYMESYKLNSNRPTIASLNFAKHAREASIEALKSLHKDIVGIEFEGTPAALRIFLGYLVQESFKEDSNEKDCILKATNKTKAFIESHPFVNKVDSPENSSNSNTKSVLETCRDHYANTPGMERKDLVKWMVEEQEVGKSTAHSYASTIIKG